MSYLKKQEFATNMLENEHFPKGSFVGSVFFETFSMENNVFPRGKLKKQN